jgi:DNA-binding NarL/FixJ family response regulator
MQTNNPDTAQTSTATNTQLVYAFMTGDTPAFPELTERERQVAICICRGQTGHEIAASLDFSVKTYDTHRGHIMKKLNLRHNIELCLLAVKRGYIRSESTAVQNATAEA